MNTYMMKFVAGNGRKAVFTELEGIIVLSFFYRGKSLAHRRVELEEFERTLKVVYQWLGGEYTMVASHLYPSPIIRWED